MAGSFNYNDEERAGGSGNTWTGAADGGSKKIESGSFSTKPQKTVVFEAGSADAGGERINPASNKVVKTSIFKNRNFLLLWISQALTQTAQHTMNIALVDFVSEISNKSATLTSVALVAFVLPGVFFSALAGAFVDRVNKRTILIVSNVLRALLVPCLVFMPNIPAALALPIIFLIICLFSTFSQFFAPAEGALIPSLVPESNLTQANSLFQITLFATQFLGMALVAPILPRLIGPQNFFLVVAGIYLFCILLAWWLPNNSETVPNKPLVETTNSLLHTMWGEIKEGWLFIRSSNTIWLAIIYLSAVQSLLFSLIGIGIPFVSSKTQGLGQEPSFLIFVLAPLSIGLGIGVWLVNIFITTRNRNRVMLFSILGLSIGLSALGLLKPLASLWVSIFTPGQPMGGWGLILALVLLTMPAGFMIACINIPALTILQERSPKDVVGRVFAAYFTFANAVSIAPILGAGALGDLIGIVPTIFVIAICMLAVAFYGYRQQPVIHKELIGEDVLKEISIKSL